MQGESLEDALKLLLVGFLLEEGVLWESAADVFGDLVEDRVPEVGWAVGLDAVQFETFSPDEMVLCG